MKTETLSNTDEPQPASLQKMPKWLGNSLFFRVATVVFMLQAMVLVGISVWLYTHYDLTWDFSQYYQAWYMIAHGHLNPFLSSNGAYYWQVHLEWIMWPLSLLYFLFPHGITLLVIQDLAIVGVEIAALGLMLALIQDRQGSDNGPWWWLQWVGLLVLVVNPWTYWAVMFDFHFDAIEAFFVTMAALQFYRRHILRGYIFAALCFLTSLVSVTYLVPLGALLIVWRQRRNGVLIALAGLIGFLAEQHFFYHGLGGLGLTGPSVRTVYTPVAHSSFFGSTLGPVLELPIKSISSVWTSRLNIYANLAPGGLLGVLSPVGLLIPGLVLAESSLGGPVLSIPGWQNIAVYALVATGTISVLALIARRSMRTSQIIAGFVVVNALAWSFVGGKGLPSRTAAPDTAAAATLQQLRQTIPETAEVVASQGVIGRFGGRLYVYLFRSSIPIKSRLIYFIVSPYNGINESSTIEELSRVDFLAHQPAVQLVTHRGNIWAFEWRPPHGTKRFFFGGNSMALSAWTLRSEAGYPVLTGPVSSWHLTNRQGQVGYIESGAYWGLAPGQYQLSVEMSSTGPVTLEVWNATRNQLLLRRSLVATAGKTIIQEQFNNQGQSPLYLYNGQGVLSFHPVPNPSLYDSIEVRVWSNGSSHTDLYSIGLKYVGRS